jgi:ppGpp synthetase/RelA/SpoT-type nucleotidyltranferase
MDDSLRTVRATARGSLRIAEVLRCRTRRERGGRLRAGTQCLYPSYRWRIQGRPLAELRSCHLQWWPVNNGDQELDLLTIVEPGEETFDFDQHRHDAEESYRSVRGHFESFAETIRTLLGVALADRGIRVHSVQARAKEVESFGRKAGSPSDDTPNSPKYQSPMADITDMAGCRVITFFLNEVELVDRVIASQFQVTERSNRSAFLRAQGSELGYESMHYLVRLDVNRLALPEYSRFRDMTAEIQVRTILQHAWAEIQHDVQYKAVDVLPSEIRRRFLALAGMIEISDREFQAIADAYSEIRAKIPLLIDEDKLSEIELTPESLKAYLDKRYGPDGRMSDFSYKWTAKNLRALGFQNLRKLANCISGYDDDKISRHLHGNRQGQLQRLEDVLIVSMGEVYLTRHSWALDHITGEPQTWIRAQYEHRREIVAAAGLATGIYDPVEDNGQ